MGIVSILKGHSDVELIIEAENGKDLLDKIKSNHPHVIFLDLNMPVMGGWDVLKKLKEGTTTARVIILSMYEDQNFIINAIKGGAGGFLSKNAEPEEIILAMESVLQSGYYFNEKISMAMLKKMMAQESINPVLPSAPIELTEREEQVLALLRDEMSCAEIAEKLYVGKRSIELVRLKLLEKFGAKNSVGIVLNAVKKGFIQI